MVSIEKYRKFDPFAETIIEGKSGELIVIDRYGPDDYSSWITDANHLYDDTYGSSVRGTLKDILHELSSEI